MKSMSLRRKFIMLVGGAIALLLFIASTLTVGVIANLTRSSVENDVSSLVKLEASRIEMFFSRYGGVARTFLNEPAFQSFFIDHTTRGIPASERAGTEGVKATFSSVSSGDPNIKSAFFASDNTGEYFYENDPVGVETDGPNAGDPSYGYFATQRPWYQSAVQRKGLFVSPPAVDSQDGTVSAVVQSPVYAGGQLIGVGGVDILISTVGQVVDQIRYHGEGTAFLLDDEQNIVYFPKQKESLELSQGFATFDKVFADSEGFAELTRSITRSSDGIEKVMWRGESFIAVFHHAKLDDPEMNWTLGMLIPESMIEGPITTTKLTSAFAALVMILIITAVTYVATSKVTLPLKRLKDAMTDIASGDGDLTQRITIEANDEVGVLAEQFNLFTGKLQRLLKETANSTDAVATSADRLRDVSGNTSMEMEQEKQQVDSVTTAVTEMAATVLDISKNAQAASQAADQAESLAGEGAQQAEQAMSEINGLAVSIQQAVDVVSTLSKESENIGAVIDVITSIAEQTNLLALNAAIEAARAGEQGRGFAVVADEVRSLASRTQESTDDIRDMVEKLQQMAQQTESVMQQGNARTEQGVKRAEQVRNSLKNIDATIRTVQEQSSSIAVATEQQTVVAENINESLVAITELSDVTSNHAKELATEATQLSKVSDELAAVVNQFKV